MLRKLLVLICVSIFMTLAVSAQTDTAVKPAPAATTAETPKAARFTPNKDQIMQGQNVLKQAKLYSGEATGVYNDDTRAAIRTWQKNNGIAVSGNFNRATLEKMGIPLTDKQKGSSAMTTASSSDDTPKKATPATKSTTPKRISASGSGDAAAGETEKTGPKRPAPFQATNDQIKQLQHKLIEAKLFTGEADGNRSDALKVAVLKYQKNNGLKTTGGINAETLKKMDIPLTEKQKEQVAAQSAYDATKAPTKED